MPHKNHILHSQEEISHALLLIYQRVWYAIAELVRREWLQRGEDDDLWHHPSSCRVDFLNF
jgi:hypothetical protein